MLRAQQQSVPVVGFLSSASPGAYAEELRGFRRGLDERGYVEGHNVVIEYRWANDQSNRLPALASDLVKRTVSVITAVGSPAARVAKASTTTIPIVFYVGVDPIHFGLVASLSRPDGNLTGVTNLSLEAGPKRLERWNALRSAAVKGSLTSYRLDVRLSALHLADSTPQPPTSGDRLGGVAAMPEVAMRAPLGPPDPCDATMHPAAPSSATALDC